MTRYGSGAVVGQATTVLLYALPLAVGYQAYRKHGLALAAGQAAAALGLAFAIGFGGIGSPLLMGAAGAWMAPDGYKALGAVAGALTPFALVRL